MDTAGGDLVRSLVALGRAGATGVLEVVAEGITTRLYFDRGTPVFSGGGSLQTSLGQILLSRGAIDDAQFDEVVHAMTLSFADAEQLRFGEVAIQRGLVSPDQIAAALVEQTRRRALECMRHDETEQWFEESEDAVAGIGKFRCELVPLIVEGVRTCFSPMRVERVLGPSLDLYPQLARKPGEIARDLGLRGPELRFLRTVDGTRPARRLVDASPVDAIVSLHLLTLLVLFEEVTLASEPAAGVDPMASEVRPRAQPEPHQDVYESTMREVPEARAAAAPVAVAAVARSGVARSGAPRRARIAPAFARQLSAMHGARPERSAEERREIALRRAAEIKMRLQGRRSPPGAAADGSSDAAAEAHTCHLRGRRHLDEGNFAQAAHELARAHELVPQRGDYGLAAAFARFRAARDVEERTSLAADLAQRVKSALADKPDDAFCFYARGHLALAEGEEKKAAKAFKRAADLDPSNMDAARHARLLSRRLHR